ncbi:kinesin-like protein KIF26B isoform X7 [Hippocampus zosterae]|uniref:kinesin-like protein KIF26B isoform X7 n=1 Tax=Hippocampus zosterae TaxID=109293 RepID=UPI00223D9F74|nr:kinesin-like protein KIF26B isoform X7 [Hippocampus zosterae]
MTSLSGSKERSVAGRGRKYTIPDTSPTKSASFFPDTWYRKAYEETSRSSSRPAPEGAGSMPSSTGTPSPGSGISSPGSLSGSPGTISPGICTGSPGSLGGSPGFGTGSPASGSGSSPGSERGIWCENCNTRLTELKRQALKLLIPGPYSSKISQMVSEASREGLTEAALNRYNTHSPSHTNSTPHTNSPSHTAATTTTSHSTSLSAASFFARAAQKLNLTSKKRKLKAAATVPLPVTTSAPTCDSQLFPTNFSSALLSAPPPAPPCLLRAANKIKDTPGLGKVKVMVRVCPASQSNLAESSSFLKVDPRKKQITIMDPSTNQTPSAASQKRVGSNQVPPKMFTFDGAFPPDASQAEVCAGTVAEVIQSVVNGADGCVFCFGHSKLGKSYTMIGHHDSLQTLGIIPCAISWLFKLINERREKTGARFSVRVSAVEVWGKDENLKDLLSEVATGSLQDGQSPGVYLCEDPICGMQLQNQSELRAPTPEKAAWFLDAAIAARHSSQRHDTTEEDHRNSHMLFTLHIYQYRMEKTGKGGMSGGRSRLHLLDLGSCDVGVLEGGAVGKGRENSSASSAPLCLSLSALGNVILALVNGSKHIPYKDSKLTMLLRESLGNMNCRTTMIAHISASPADFSESLSTIQIASRVLRMKKKKTKVTVQYTSSSSGGESSCEEGRMRRPTHLRPFHHRGDPNSDLPLLRLSNDPDEQYSSSEQSCDTVIYVGPNGAAVSDRELTDNEGPPEFVPIIPALLRAKSETLQSQAVQKQVQPEPESQDQQGGPSQAQSILGQPLAPVPEEGAECLKCNTFAELQERLDCIDGSEEVAKFPFEEVLVCKQGSKDPRFPSEDSVSPTENSSVATLDTEAKTGGPVQLTSSSTEHSRRKTNEEQLQDIKEVVEEAELAQTIIHSLAQSSGSTFVSGSRNVTGSNASNPLHRSKASLQHDNRENLTMGVNTEGKTRPLGSPRLGIASLTKTSEYRPPSSPSQRCKVYTQKGVIPATSPLASHTLAQEGQATEALNSDNSLAADSGRSSTKYPLSRTSPVGMSPQVKDPTPSLSTSLGSAETLCDDDVPPIPLDTHRDGLAGHHLLCDELSVYTGAAGEEEALDDTALMMTQRLTCRPPSIISFNSDCYSVDAQPCGVLTSPVEDGAAESFRVIATSSAVTEVVAMAEVTMAKLHMEGDAIASVMTPIASWMSDLSGCSEGDHSLHSFSQSQSHQGEALAEHNLISLGLDGAGDNGSSGCFRRGSLDGVMSENRGVKGTQTKDSLRKMPPSMAKTTIQSLTALGSHSTFKTPISTHSCVAIKQMAMQEPTLCSSPTKLNTQQLASISSEMNFEDPWLVRVLEDVRPNEVVRPVKNDAEHSKSQSGQRTETAGNGNLENFCRDVEEHGGSSSNGEVVSSPDSYKRVVDGCEMVTGVAQGECLADTYNPEIHRTASLPRAWHRLNRHDGLDNTTEYKNFGTTSSTPCSPRATLDRRGSTGKQGFFSHKKSGIPPLPPVRKSSLDLRNRAASPLNQPIHEVSMPGSSTDESCAIRQHVSSIDSGRLFSAKLEQLASRTNSLGRAHSGSHHYDCFSLERAESLRGGGCKGDGSIPRTGRSLTRAGNGFGGSSGPSSAPQSPAKSSGQSKISAVSKLLMTSSPKSRSLSASSTKTLSFSTKSLSQASSRSSSLPPNGKPQSTIQGPVQQQGPSPASWSTQSLSRSRGGSLAAKLPLRAVNGRISELLQGSGGSRSRNHAHAGGADSAEEKVVGGTSGGALGAGGVLGGGPGEERTAAVQSLPSPYSKITAPRKPHRCSSGHASDNSSVLSGELPPAMGKTALFYHSGGSSGYESMLRDSSENTGSTSSAQDSLSEHSSATTSSRRSSKSNKKGRSNTGHLGGLQRRRLIPALTLDSSSSPHRTVKQSATSSSSSSSSPGAYWVDGPLGPPASANPRGPGAMAEAFEIKVYEIDDVERLQKRRDKGAVYINGKLRLLEHRQQRISEVRAKYQCLKKELEQTKQHLMLEPHTWTTEFELQQVYEVDSLEYLEALETVTDKLENRVNFCKAHLMMITCFDVSSRHR